MYTNFQLAKKYLSYYLHASNSKGHGMHSPFVFDFILRVLNNKNNYQPPAAIEDLRKKLMADKRILQIEDLGAGSRTAATQQRTVQQLATTALKPKKYARLLYRLAKHYRPQTIVELGTSLGVTTSYLSSASAQATVTTLEGSKAVAGIAKEVFNHLSLQNIQLIQGNFDDVLPAALHPLSAIDLAYIDGNHRYEPTMRYFNQLLSKAHNNSILVFDDIHWSVEMEEAWAEIKEHPSVKYTIDIFFLGFVFFRSDFKVKQHFTVRF